MLPFYHREIVLTADLDGLAPRPRRLAESNLELDKIQQKQSTSLKSPAAKASITTTMIDYSGRTNKRMLKYKELNITLAPFGN